jgi:hypothetical protein
MSSRQEGPDQHRGIKQAEGWVRALLHHIVDVNIDLIRLRPIQKNNERYVADQRS